MTPIAMVSSGTEGLTSADACAPVGVKLPLTIDTYYGETPAEYTLDPSVCTATDGWPQHTCSLKTNVTTPPSFWPGNDTGKY